MKSINVVLVTNVPAPYRIPVLRKLAESCTVDLTVIYCSQPHIDTTTTTTEYGFKHLFLNGYYFAKGRRFIHADLSIWKKLNQLQPDVVITIGYIPTFLIAFTWAITQGIPHVAMTDGTAKSEQAFSWLHRLLRKTVLKRSATFVGACEGSLDLFRLYGAPEDRLHKSYLCADNSVFNQPATTNPVDFIFCGRFLNFKKPLFAMEVALATAQLLNRKTSIDFAGSGDLELEMRSYAKEIADFVDTRFLGYATQAELPCRYANAKIFLFPTEGDVWGVVANEACASGLPVIVSPYAGVSGELIIDGSNGFIRELEVDLWAKAAAKLLSDTVLYQTFSQNSRTQVAEYSFDNSAKGLSEAIMQAYELTQ
jgi:glycosyltransferase involved in cell wall biosynthesis